MLFFALESCELGSKRRAVHFVLLKKLGAEAAHPPAVVAPRGLQQSPVVSKHRDSLPRFRCATCAGETASSFYTTTTGAGTASPACRAHWWVGVAVPTSAAVSAASAAAAVVVAVGLRRDELLLLELRRAPQHPGVAQVVDGFQGHRNR